MPKFLIQVPHEPDELACCRVVEVFLKTGSHFLTNADWGCMDEEHSAWMLVEIGSKDEARRILPPIFRAQAKIVQLNKFTMEEVNEILRSHGDDSAKAGSRPTDDGPASKPAIK